MKSPLRGECRRRPPYLSIYLSIYLRGWAHESRPASLHSKGRRRRAEGISLRRGAPKCKVAFSPPAPFLGLWRECVRGPKGDRSASSQVAEGKRPLRRSLPGKRRESPLTAGGGARNISPCAADGRKRRGGALDAPGTLKTGYRGKRIGTRAGPPPAWCRRRSPTRDQFQEEPDPGFRPSFRWLFLYFIFELRRPSGRPNEEFDPGSG